MTDPVCSKHFLHFQQCFFLLLLHRIVKILDNNASENTVKRGENDDN